MINRLNNIIKDNKFRINVFLNKVNVVNYQEIIDISYEEIILSYDNKLIYIKGKDLVVNKLVDKEVLITGSIGSIEFR